MTATVKEIMNSELFALSPADTVEDARTGLLAMGVSSAPVLDLRGHPLGQVSLRHLVGARDGALVFEYMTVPACTLYGGALIADAARLLVHADHTHIVVVDTGNHAVGAVSAVDVLRAIIGHPVRHPSAFPHRDADTEIVWTDDRPWGEAGVNGAPAGPGVFALVLDAPGSPRRIVWAEAAADVQTRLLEMLYLPQDDAELTQWLAHRSLQFRVAELEDPKRRLEVLEKVWARIRGHAESAPETPAKAVASHES